LYADLAAQIRDSVTSLADTVTLVDAPTDHAVGAVQIS